MDYRSEKQKASMAEIKEEPDLRYGFCSWKPSWLQCMNTGGAYVLFMFLSNTILSMTVNGLVGVVLTNLETRFELSSNQSSWIASAYEVAAIPVMLAVSLFGHRSHRPRVVAVGLFLMVIGCILFVLPHFTTGLYTPGSELLDHGVCLTEENSYNGTIKRSCNQGGRESGQLSTYLGLFIIARVLQGLGTVPLQTLGVTYLDDVVTKEQFSLYVALYFAGGVLGPAIGYIAGGYMLELFTDFGFVDPKALGITSSDPRWVGAWWLGFLVGGIILFFVSFPFFGFADDMPGAAEIRATKESEAHGQETEDTVNDNLAQLSWGELFNLVKIVITNPCFVFLSLYCITDAFIVTGFANFGPKYVERQFGVSSSLAGMLFGLISIPGGVGGTIFGGWMIKRFQLKVPQILKLEIFLTFLLIASGTCFFIVCDTVDFAGVTKDYANSTSQSKPQLIAPCNENCSCAFVPFNPVCGKDNVLYYSPCHAGCATLDQFPGKSFGNCSCISSQISSDTHAKKTNCTSPDCTLMPLFMVLFFIGMFIIFVCSGMNCTVTLRIVQKDTRALALGLQGVMTRLIGTFPGPIAFGAAFDKACILWQKTCSGGTGSCQFYDNKSMSLYLFLVSIGIKIVSVLFMVIAWRAYKAPTEAPSSVVEKTVTNVTNNQYKNGVDSPVFVADSNHDNITTSSRL